MNAERRPGGVIYTVFFIIIMVNRNSPVNDAKISITRRKKRPKLQNKAMELPNLTRIYTHELGTLIISVHSLSSRFQIS